MRKLILLILLAPFAANAAVIPVGVQTGIARSTVSDDWGWTECYSTSGNSSGDSLAAITAGCSGDYLMMAAYNNASPDTYAILAAAEFADATFDTGRQNGFGNDVTHTANGSEWYYHNNWSWGFSELGNAVELNSCDIELHDSYSDNTGMCWHTSQGRISGGWALNDGNNWQSLYSSSWNRVLLVADVPEPGVLALLGLGLFGLGMSRRRK